MNYVLLPDRQMNPARYKTAINGEKTWLFDEAPAMLQYDPRIWCFWDTNCKQKIDLDMRVPYTVKG